MGDVILYSTGCPQCRVLKDKLDAAGIKYTIVDDVDVMLEKGFTAAPVLEVDGESMGFKVALDWLKATSSEADCDSCKI